MRSAALALFTYTRCIECLGNQWNPLRSDTVAGGNSKSDGWPDQSAMSSHAHTRMQSCTFITLYSRHKEWKRNTLKLWLLRRIQVDSCQKDFFLFLFFYLFLRQTLCHGALKSFSTGTPSLLSQLYRSKPHIRPQERWNGKCPKLYVKVNAKLYLLLPTLQPPLHQHRFLTFTLNIN